MLVYLDSVILIYALDHTGSFQSRALDRLAASRSAGDRLAISDLTRLECRVRPPRLKDSVRLGEYDTFFARGDVLVMSITAAVFDRATAISAAQGFKSLDSIHLAAAAEAGCDLFLTNVARLSRFSGIRVEVLP
jgi:predicted nucleic acid-binding protein